MYNSLIIDVNNCYWRTITSRKITKIVKGSDELITSGIYGTLDSINNFESKYLAKDGKIYLLFDNPDSTFIIKRESIDPDYKSNRANMTKEFKKGLEILLEVCKVYKDNYNVILAEKLEADDLVYPLLRKLKDEKILLISNDMDWARCISDKVFWFDWNMIYYPENFKEKFGFYPYGKKVQLFKTFHGDKADNIPNPFYNQKESIDWKFPHESLMEIIMSCNDLDEFFSKFNKRELNLTNEWYDRIERVKTRIRLNFQLVDFIAPNLDITECIYQCSFKKNECAVWFNTLEFDLESRMIDQSPDTFWKLPI